MIAFVTLEGFRARLEERENPLLEGRAFAIVTTERGGTVLALSEAALAAGLRPGMRWAEALGRCPTLARVVARPGLYAGHSDRLMAALAEISPALEAFDEATAYLDLTDCQAYYRHDPERIAALIRATVAQASNLPCRVGLGGDKTSARWAAGPASATRGIIRPEAAAQALAPHPVAEVTGIGPAMEAVLAAHGVRVCGDMHKLSIHLLARHFGNQGRRVWLMAQGRDPSPVLSAPGDDPRFRHHRRLPPGTRDLLLLQTAYLQLADRLATGLRREDLRVSEFLIGLRGPEGWREERVRLDRPCADMRVLLPLCARFLRRHWFGEEVGALRLSACLEPEPVRQPDIFMRATG